MIVYDVVRVVSAEGARQTSYRLGRQWIEVHDDERRAQDRVERYNACRNVESIVYVVEEHAELSPERAPE
jgi:hypothetical protein